MAQYVSQQTLQYSTFLKRALVESLQAAFLNHPSTIVANTQVAIDWSHERWRLPGIIIKFFEREIPDVGVGHFEYLPAPQTDPNNPTQWIKYYHRYYKGDISFEVYGQSTVDRDVIRDSLVEVLAMRDVTSGGNAFLERFYYSIDQTPYGDWHFPVLMLDQLTGYGETERPAPWRPEDDLVYQVTYRVPIFGEFYSNTPPTQPVAGVIQEIDVYPYMDGIDPPPEQAAPGDWLHFTGWPAGEEVI